MEIVGNSKITQAKGKPTMEEEKGKESREGRTLVSFV